MGNSCHEIGLLESQLAVAVRMTKLLVFDVLQARVA